MMRRTVSRLMGTSFGAVSIPPVHNEPCLNFAPGSSEAKALAASCKKVRTSCVDIPIVIGGKEYRTADKCTKTIPSDHGTTIATYYNATPELVQKAIDNNLETYKEWSRTPFQHRAAILLKAANLLATSHRFDFQAATMIGQSKNPWQAEIDSVTETIDFFRWNVKFAEDIYKVQPQSPNAANIWNMSEYRPLEGYIACISPFNFTAIGANLAAVPAMLGNVICWKPSPAAILGNWETLKLLEECGLPPGVVNFVPCAPEVTKEVMLRDPNLAGVAFTGSTAVFTDIWQNVATNLPNYKTYPRVSGETGGKNCHLVHPSADMNSVAAGTLRSAFEFQGQKCSACSRAWFPKSKWPEIKEKMLAAHSKLKQGQPDDFESFMCAVIDKNAFDKNKKFIDIAKSEASCKIIAGGNCDDSKGWFVEPTIIEASEQSATTLREEIFGPVVTVYVYDDSKPGFWEQACADVDKGTKYGLTGSIYARDRKAIHVAQDALRGAQGNLYINDKSTGAVVGMQPFGGARGSGTNDKPGAPQFLHRWLSPRTIKETVE